MRKVAAIVTLAVLAGCAAEVPDSGRGVGYSDYQRYEIERARREAALNGTIAPSAASGLAPIGGTPVAADTVTPGALAPLAPAGSVTTAELSAAGIGPATAAPAPYQPGAAPAPYPSAPAPYQAAAVPAPPPANSTGLSDEQNFNAVSSRETIESDAQRLQQAAANYQVVQPTALPQRAGDTGPNIVQYALSAPNRRGQEWYSRSIVAFPGRFQRACAGFASPDEAQRAFLSRGGPERDPGGLDPDGDGFACGWDPAPFRAAVGRG